MRKLLSLILLLFTGLLVSAQVNNADFKDGYILKSKDTIRCKIKFDSKQDYPRKEITILLNNEENNFFAGGTITGFAVQENGTSYHYGTVDIEIQLGPERRVNTIFLKKIVAGIISLYEYEYRTTTSRTTTRDGVVQPGSTSTTQSHIDYYISKSDSAHVGLANPVLLAGYRKKDLEVYLSDDTELFAREEKRYSHKELLATLKEYNERYWSKK